jgi:hypothetical protein
VALSVWPSLEAISFALMPSPPQHIIIVFSSKESCLPLGMAARRVFSVKKIGPKDEATLVANNRLMVNGRMVIFRHAKVLPL